MMQIHDLKAHEYYLVEFEHVSTGSLDVDDYMVLDPTDNTYQTMEMEAMSRYLERPSVEGAIQQPASKNLKNTHKVNNDRQ